MLALIVTGWVGLLMVVVLILGAIWLVRHM